MRERSQAHQLQIRARARTQTGGFLHSFGDQPRTHQARTHDARRPGSAGKKNARARACFCCCCCLRTMLRNSVRSLYGSRCGYTPGRTHARAMLAETGLDIFAVVVACFARCQRRDVCVCVRVRKMLFITLPVYQYVSVMVSVARTRRLCHARLACLMNRHTGRVVVVSVMP